jgi:hypothetical protein
MRQHVARGFEAGVKKPPAMELRPLGFGEIFDRAVTLYIRNFVPFVAIVMVLVLPLAVLQYVVDVGSQPQFDAMIRIFENPILARTQRIPTMFDSPRTLAAMGILLLLSSTIWPFVLNAVAVGVARLYRGRPVEFRACYDVVLARWLQILGVIGMELLVFAGWYIVVGLLGVALVLITMSLGAAMPAFGPVIGLFAALLVLLVMLPPIAPLVVAFTFAMYAVVIEERAVIDALVLGFSRVFNRREFWRALLFAVAVCAIGLGASTMFSMLGIVAAMFRLPALQAIIQALPMAIISPLTVVIFAIYYFDVRIRREAFDLEAGLERLTAAQPA